MAVLNVLLLGNPKLHEVSHPVKMHDVSNLKGLIKDLHDTLMDFKRRTHTGRAIAAPQIGAPLRIVHVEMGQPWSLINPEIVNVGEEDFVVWDDCFSFPNLLVRVSRAHRIRIKYEDVKGRTHFADLEGDRAELLQHELDHLDGVLAVDRPHGLDPFCLREEWNRLHSLSGRYGHPEPRSALYSAPLAGLL
jgi:peptide deformylase